MRHREIMQAIAALNARLDAIDARITDMDTKLRNGLRAAYILASPIPKPLPSKEEVEARLAAMRKRALERQARERLWASYKQEIK